jgi:hypothetical protein
MNEKENMILSKKLASQIPNGITTFQIQTYLLEQLKQPIARIFIFSPFSNVIKS